MEGDAMTADHKALVHRLFEQGFNGRSTVCSNKVSTGARPTFSLS